MPQSRLHILVIAAAVLAFTAAPLRAQDSEPSDPDSHGYQSPPPPQEQSPDASQQSGRGGDAGHAKNGRAHLKERFDRANVTHDGRLTIDQARSSMPKVAEHFDQVDLDHKGYATFDDIVAYHRKMSTARHAARAAGEAPPPS